MFYRLIRMGGKWYSFQIESIEEDAKNIEEITEQGEIVIICNDLEWFASEFKIEIDDIQIVEKYDESKGG